MRASPFSAIVLFAICLPVTAEAQPAGSARSPQAEAVALSNNYMTQVACLAKRIGQSLETVAEMTWVQAAQANAGFRHRYRSSVMATLAIKADEDRFSAQRGVAARLKRLKAERRELVCARATAHFLAAARRGQRWWNPVPGEPEPDV